MIDIEKYFVGFTNITNNPTLDAMEFFIDEYSDFEKKMKFIHIAGTNGKGSCVEILSNTLTIQGYKIGKFISPHLINYNERISINSKQISDKDLSNLIKELNPKIISYNKTHEKNVTLFELETIIALLYFYRNNVDLAILETGLGGLYDCTNIISRPLVSIITSIGLDHMNILGYDLSLIAFQKAGIIKKNSTTVFFSQSNEINDVIINTCKNKKNVLHLLNETHIKNYTYDKNYQYFDYDEKLKKISINLKGINQIKNACLCIETIKILNELGYKISEKNLRTALSTVIHKGRMEVINEKPFIIFDGAHNKPAIENFLTTVNMYYKNYKKLCIISILKKKDYKGMLKLLFTDQNADFILTSGNEKEIYVPSKKLFEAAEKYKLPNQKIYVKNLNDAVKFIIQNKKDCINFFVGSFYVYGDVIKKIEKLV